MSQGLHWIGHWFESPNTSSGPISSPIMVSRPAELPLPEADDSNDNGLKLDALEQTQFESLQTAIGKELEMFLESLTTFCALRFRLK